VREAWLTKNAYIFNRK